MRERGMKKEETGKKEEKLFVNHRLLFTLKCIIKYIKSLSSPSSLLPFSLLLLFLSFLSCYFHSSIPFSLACIIFSFFEKRGKNMKSQMINDFSFALRSHFRTILFLFFLFISSFFPSHLSFLCFLSQKSEKRWKKVKEKEKNLEEDASYHILPSFSFHFPKESSKGFYVKIFHSLFLSSFLLFLLFSLSLPTKG